MILNELPSPLHIFAHQHAEHPLGFAGFLQGDAQQHALGRIERGFPELLARRRDLKGRFDQSSFRIVPLPVPTAIVALVADDNFTKNVSSNSLIVSPFTRMVIIFTVSPGLNVSVDEAL